MTAAERDSSDGGDGGEWLDHLPRFLDDDDPYDSWPTSEWTESEWAESEWAEPNDAPSSTPRARSRGEAGAGSRARRGADRSRSARSSGRATDGSAGAVGSAGGSPVDGATADDAPAVRWWERIDPHSWVWRIARAELESVTASGCPMDGCSPLQVAATAQELLVEGPGSMPDLAEQMVHLTMGDDDAVRELVREAVRQRVAP